MGKANAPAHGSRQPGARTSVAVLVEGGRRGAAAADRVAADAGIALVLLPGRPGPLRRARSHPAAGGLRRAGLEVRVS